MLQVISSSHSIRYNSSVLLTAFKIVHPVEPLTPFNYHQWKEDMEVLIHTKKLFKVTEGTEVEPILNHDKENYFNMLDEASGYLSLSIS